MTLIRDILILLFTTACTVPFLWTLSDIHRHRRRRQQNSSALMDDLVRRRAEQQHQAWLKGDPKGLYGNYPPAYTDALPDPFEELWAKEPPKMKTPQDFALEAEKARLAQAEAKRWRPTVAAARRFGRTEWDELLGLHKETASTITVGRVGVCPVCRARDVVIRDRSTTCVSCERYRRPWSAKNRLSILAGVLQDEAAEELE